MPTFNNLSEFEKYINNKIKNALENEVEQTAKNTMSEMVDEVVYKAYEPTQYVRTGLLRTSIDTWMEDDNTLAFRNTRSDQDKDVAAIIEHGIGYTWKKSKIYQMQPYPRPFHEATAQKLDKNGIAKDALVKGLKRQGIDVEK